MDITSATFESIFHRNRFTAVSDDSPMTGMRIVTAYLRYLLVRYEDIATSPEIAVRLIYFWSGLGPLPHSVSEWIDANTKIQACGHGDYRIRHLRTNTGGSSFGYANTQPEHYFSGPLEYMDPVRTDHNTAGTTVLGASEAGVASRRTTELLRGLSGKSTGSENEPNSTECLENTEEAKGRPQGTKRDSVTMVSMWRTLMTKEEAQAVWEGCEGSGIMTALGYDP